MYDKRVIEATDSPLVRGLVLQAFGLGLLIGVASIGGIMLFNAAPTVLVAVLGTVGMLLFALGLRMESKGKQGLARKG